MRTAAAVLAATIVLAACTSSGGGGTPVPTVTNTTTITSTRTPPAGPTGPVSGPPVRVMQASSCPLLGQQPAADRVGMRLDRITVLHRGSAVVGCRFYALQNSPLHNSEHLPGPNQPAIDIETVRYHSADAAHNAFVLDARKGANPQQARIGDTTGVCYQIAFYAPDKGRDWACSFNLGADKVTVRTVVTSPALNVIEVSRVVARSLG